MYRKYVAAAWGNLVSNKFFAAINIAGLTVGFAAAILIGLYVREELSYDRWLPLHERTYLVGASVETSVRAPRYVDYSPSYIAAPFKLDFAEVEAAARLVPGNFGVRHGNVEALELIYWADPDIFDLLRFPVLAGDLDNALRRPDGVVLTRRLAQKYFGRDTPVGEKLEIDRRHSMTVMAVIEDLPSNSNLKHGFFASGLASFSALTQMDAKPANGFTISSLTYVRLRPDASAAALDLEAFVTRHGWQLEHPGYRPRLLLLPLTAIHLAPGEGAIISPRGNLSVTLALAAAGFLIIVIAGFNFINLATARAARRAREIGIRKTLGASRLDIAVQFLCEAVICALLAGAIALALVEWLLPPLRAAAGADLHFTYWSDPTLAAALLLFILAVAFAAASYPALLLSALRPAQAVRHSGAIRLRQVLVVLQFAVLTTLLIGAGVIYGQIRFALEGSVRIDQDRVHLVGADCKGAFRDMVGKLAGIESVACSSGPALDLGRQGVSIEMAGAAALPSVLRPVDLDFFDFYGLHPLAGRFFSTRAQSAGNAVTPVVVNETVLRKLNLAPASAIGRSISLADAGELDRAVIIGVVADIAMDTIRAEMPPAVYVLDASRNAYMHVRLRGGDTAGTLAAIDRLWRETGAAAPINRIELRSYARRFIHPDLIRQGTLFAAFAGISVFVAGLGLFGLAACTAERRVREVGVRKALGAADWSIVALFTWEFARPVLLANLIAWPLAFFALRAWLAGFAYHVELSPWFFAGASLLTLAIALVTVAGHAVMTARGKPGEALRYQ
jgi:putative ABC transport system permease protein